MEAVQDFPTVTGHFPDLNQFILQLVTLYKDKEINSWEDLEKLVHSFFTPARMEKMEISVDHEITWKSRKKALWEFQ